MWGDVIRYAEVTSTNDVARDHARRGASEGTVIVARHQAKGRGRRGRGWEAPAGHGLLTTFILRPPAYLVGSAWLTLAAGVAAARAASQVAERGVRLKWPNDILLDGRKLGGILTETGRSAHGPFALVGIGLNVVQTAADFGGELADKATSLALATERAVLPEALLPPLTDQLRELYRLLTQGAVESVRHAWSELDDTVGGSVVVEAPGETWEGRATAVDEHGALWVETAEGESRRVTVGDVSVRFGD